MKNIAMSLLLMVVTATPAFSEGTPFIDIPPGMLTAPPLAVREPDPAPGTPLTLLELAADPPPPSESGFADEYTRSRLQGAAPPPEKTTASDDAVVLTDCLVTVVELSCRQPDGKDHLFRIPNRQYVESSASLLKAKNAELKLEVERLARERGELAAKLRAISDQFAAPAAEPVESTRADKAVVINATATLHGKAAKSSPVVAVLKKGTILTVRRTNGAWSEVSVRGKSKQGPGGFILTSAVRPFKEADDGRDTHND